MIGVESGLININNISNTLNILKRNVLPKKEDNNIYSWYINNETLDEAIVEKVDFISECIHDGLSNRVSMENFRNDMHTLEKNLMGNRSNGVKHRIYSENNILINGIDNMIKANKNDELGFQYVTAEIHSREEISKQLRKGQQMNFIADDTARFFSEDQGAEMAMKNIQSNNAYLYNVATLFDSGRVVSEEGNNFFPINDNEYRNSGFAVCMKMKEKIYIVIVEGYIFHDAKKVKYRTFHGFLYESNMNDPIYFNGSIDEHYLRPGIERLSDDLFYGKPISVNTGLSSYIRIMIKFIGDYGQRIIASIYQKIHAASNSYLSISTGDGNMAAFCIKGIDWVQNGLIRIPVYYHKKRTIEFPGQTVKCKSPGYIILITFFQSFISEESKKNKKIQLNLDKENIRIKYKIDEIFKENEYIKYLINSFLEIKRQIESVRRPLPELINSFNTTLQNLTENISQVSKKQKKMLTKNDLSHTFKEQLINNNLYYDDILERVIFSVKENENIVDKYNCLIQKNEKEMMKLQKQIDKDMSSHTKQKNKSKETWIPGKFHPRKYIDSNGNEIFSPNNTQLSNNSDYSDLYGSNNSYNSNNSNYFQGNQISVSNSLSSRSSKINFTLMNITGKKRRHGGNKSKKKNK